MLEICNSVIRIHKPVSACKYVLTFHGLRHYQGRLMLFLGGNVYNVMLHVNAATLRGLTSFILCLI